MLGWEFPPFSSGGLGTHCYNITRAMSQRGLDVTFVMPGSSDDVHSDFIKIINAGKQKLIKLGIALVPYLPSLPIKRSGNPNVSHDKVYGEGFLEDVRRYTELAFRAASDVECDLIHCHDWMTFPAGIRIKKEREKPLVVTVHSTEFDRTGSLCPNPWISDIEWQGMYHADKVITVSNYMKNQVMEKFGVPEDKIEVVHNSINPEYYPNGKISFGLDEKIVLFLGRLTLQKGPDYFLQAAKRVLEKKKGVRFVVVGTGDMLPQLIDMSINMGISNNVIFTGFQESIEDFYRMADLYVMPSVSEPFGITALEAMSLGAPVIISKQSGVSEVIKHKLTVDFWDIDGLASKILGVLTYDSVRRDMSSNGHKEVNNMSWLDVADKTIGLYSKTLRHDLKCALASS